MQTCKHANAQMHEQNVCLQIAAQTGNASVVKALLALNADADYRTPFGVTALHVAAMNGSPFVAVPSFTYE